MINTKKAFILNFLIKSIQSFFISEILKSNTIFIYFDIVNIALYKNHIYLIKLVYISLF